MSRVDAANSQNITTSAKESNSLANGALRAACSAGRGGTGAGRRAITVHIVSCTLGEAGSEAGKE
jgi:hypothetical protein